MTVEPSEFSRHHPCRSGSEDDASVRAQLGALYARSDPSIDRAEFSYAAAGDDEMSLGLTG